MRKGYVSREQYDLLRIDNVESATTSEREPDSVARQNSSEISKSDCVNL